MNLGEVAEMLAGILTGGGIALVLVLCWCWFVEWRERLQLPEAPQAVELFTADQVAERVDAALRGVRLVVTYRGAQVVNVCAQSAGAMADRAGGVWQFSEVSQQNGYAVRVVRDPLAVNSRG